MTPATIAFKSRSRETMGRSPRAASGDGRRSSLLLRLGVRVDQGAGLPVLRIEQHARPGLLELRDVAPLDVLELHHEHARLGPLAVGRALHLPDDGPELVSL